MERQINKTRILQSLHADIYILVVRVFLCVTLMVTAYACEYI